MKLQTAFSKILKGLIVLSLVLFLSSAGFQDKMTSGWYQQYFPNLNGSTIKDITFLDSLTGFAVTNSNSLLQEYILRTTNGGDNWEINYTYNTPNSNWYFTNIDFINLSTGFAFSWTKMFKTTNGGTNWEMITTNLYPEDVSLLSKDTILAVKSNALNGGVYRSTDGGSNWSMIWTNSNPNRNPAKIYMFDKNVGFIQDLNYSASMLRTTNGGNNWDYISGEYFSSIKFLNSNTGWKVYDSIKKTTNGGLNWYAQKTPNISNQFIEPTSLSVLNKDTVWIVGAYSNKPLIYKTTNGGMNWGYQFADTAYPISSYYNINFVDSKHGWVFSIYGMNNLLYHTTVGGNDTTVFTGINPNSDVIVSDYKLFQNYPNPFNPSTTISYSLAKSGNVSIKVFDISGKEIEELVNKRLQAGSYKITFNASKYSSGIYFYSMIIDGNVIDTKKMIYLK